MIKHTGGPGSRKKEARRDETEDSLPQVADVHLLHAPGTGQDDGAAESFHYHEQFEIILVQRGSVRLMVNYMLRTLPAGSVVMLASGVPHELVPGAGAGSRVAVVHIPRALLQWDMERIPELCGEYAFVNGSRRGYLFSNPALLRRATRLVRKIQGDKGFMRISHVFQLLHLLAAAGGAEHLVEGTPPPPAPPGTPGRRGQDATARAVAYLRQHYAEALTLEQVATHAGSNKTALCRAFKRATGYTPFQFLARLRVEQACRLLAATADGIGSIAWRVGYNTLSHFNLQFKAIMGMAPGEYRKNALR